MSDLHLIARSAIQPGKSDAFRSIASKCIVAVRENEMDKGCSRYDWFFNDDYSICDVLEKYSGNEAIFEHMNNVGSHLQELMAISEFSGSIYGNPSDAVKSAMDGMDVIFFSFEAGA